MFTAIDDDRIWHEIELQRAEFLRFLKTLKAEEWDALSKCDNWRTRDVVAHLIIVYKYTGLETAKGLVRHGLRINKFLEQSAVMYGKRPVATLLRDYEATVTERKKPKSIHALNVLSDLLIHEQDIRLALNKPRAMPLTSLRLIFAHWRPEDFNFGERITGVKKRVKGLKLHATDIDITLGKGDLVSGRAEHILLAISGRSFHLNDLAGPGSSFLQRRLK